MDATTLGAFSQPEVLIARMEEAGMSHGVEARIDLPKAHMVIADGQPSVLFCPVDRIRVRRTLKPGNGRRISGEVVVRGLEFRRAGLHDLMNVLVRTNGRVELIVDRETEVWPTVDEEARTGGLIIQAT
ncbi:MAG: hypothetical protein KJI72_03030 [Patescibacteria group bacterium]|nr:hypothetical protein [Patescibacteria group bacterium]